jgi:hypothetical protein
MEMERTMQRMMKLLLARMNAKMDANQAAQARMEAKLDASHKMMAMLLYTKGRPYGIIVYLYSPVCSSP